jgi:hypothetical protein
MSSQSLPTKGHPDAACTAFAPIVSRGAPPLELLEEIYAAGRIHEQLHDNGQHVCFATTPGERTRIELHDEADGSVRTLSTAQVLELAGGRPLE